jgi:DNA polymerase delta subunit 1
MDAISQEKTDVLIGYHVFQYDWKYIYGRAQILVDDATAEETVFPGKLGYLLEDGGKVVERELASNAFGQNFFYYLDTPGVIQLDLLQWFRKNRNLESYSLNNVSKLYLGDQKDDLPAMKIFEKFEGDAEDRAVIAKYAAQDTLLPLKARSQNVRLQRPRVFLEYDTPLQADLPDSLWMKHQKTHTQPQTSRRPRLAS